MSDNNDMLMKYLDSKFDGLHEKIDGHVKLHEDLRKDVDDLASKVNEHGTKIDRVETVGKVAGWGIGLTGGGGIVAFLHGIFSKGN